MTARKPDSWENEVIDRLGRIETKLDNDYRVLNGNGHPGLIARVEGVERDVVVIKAKNTTFKEWMGWLIAGAFAIMNLYVSFRR